MAIIKLSHFDKTIELTKGQKCSYRCHQHTSVGLNSDFKISNPQVLGFVEANFLLKNSKQEFTPVPGGDEATKTYIFEAKNKGICQLSMKTYNRGTLNREHTIDIIIK